MKFPEQHCLYNPMEFDINIPKISLRQYYAAKAMQGMLAALAHPQSLGIFLTENSRIPMAAFEYADAMIEFEKEEK